MIFEKIKTMYEIDTNGCWNWLGSKVSDGYGKVNYEGKDWLTHRLFYTLFKGKIPLKIKGRYGFAVRPVIMHLCNNTNCCNPEHLKIGTNKENSQHMVDCGRSNSGMHMNYGETSGCSKLTNKKVLEIRNKYNTNKYTQKQLADEYKVSSCAISDVVNKKTWYHI